MKKREPSCTDAHSLSAFPAFTFFLVFFPEEFLKKAYASGLVLFIFEERSLSFRFDFFFFLPHVTSKFRHLSVLLRVKIRAMFWFEKNT